MASETIQACLDHASWVNYATLVATVCAVIAAGSAFFSYRLSKNIYDETFAREGPKLK